MSTNRFITVHLLVTLGLHNLNRDGNGLPKSQFDGGVQRARLSSQSIKRGARQLYRDAGHDESVRTRLGAFEIARRVAETAEQRDVPIDLDAVIDVAIKAVRALYAGTTNTTALQANRTKIRDLLRLTQGQDAQQAAATAAAEQDTDEQTAGAGKETATKDTITFISTAELDACAEAILAAQDHGAIPEIALVKDSTSAALDIAAFGRMFAEQPGLGTHAAVSVSHATTVHRMQLITDYFTAVEDVANTDHGAAHIGENYFTSGTYYRSFTIDIDQLQRSWSAYGGQHAPAVLADLVRALILALPSGKVNGTNAGALPDLVLAEVQNFRIAYGFEEPVEAGEHGGYAAAGVAALAAQRRRALAFEPALFGEAVVTGRTHDADFAATVVDDCDALVDFVVDKAFQGR
ncbi:type I-E CRISPR-associated protein Cas7/Cse4/CasC [Leekyejoonella antrihumi]|uniref:Type I-E CRISPR-associated protein Cas7/Cse4/CasC n=1 Tax=Leekyejoonella antrihumi TaxID=1660198 RepID=A0A563DRF2_9MICO|nr:type I-E CRISPR-associated protein Cas7/Cse4/CasC [Leekyejoonella antrihumi]TWP32837.1 type I-E CRISPR-associated protein Cas7/Cse4/CasC [Leekyejoonella antrihumi]